MPLPILQPTSHATPQTLVRLFYQTELNWGRHLGEENALDLGTALINPLLARVAAANLVFNVSSLKGFAEAEAFYTAQGSRLGGLVPDPTSDAETYMRELPDWLLWRREIFSLGRRAAASPLVTPPETKIIPARASFRHARQLADDMTAGRPEAADAAMLHLDDPHVDALLALCDGRAVAGVAVLAMGEVGRIDQLYVSESARRKGLGRLMVSRALEICARALFKHVMISLPAEASAAQQLIRGIGFEAIGKIDLYFAPVRGEPGLPATSEGL